MSLKQDQFIKIIPPPKAEGEVRFVVPAKYKAGGLRTRQKVSMFIVRCVVRSTTRDTDS